jgi:putative FmdB family regulatory protein
MGLPCRCPAGAYTLLPVQAALALEEAAVPIFEYECRSCRSSFEEFVRSADQHGNVACPQCGGSDVQRKLSVFAARQGAEPQRDLPPACRACGAVSDSCPASRFAG